MALLTPASPRTRSPRAQSLGAALEEGQIELSLGHSESVPGLAVADGGGPADSASLGEQIRALLFISCGVFGALSIWFVASAVLMPLKAEWGLSDAEGSFLTSVVNLGFCLGCLLVALFNLADVIAPQTLILAGSLGAATANAGMLLVSGLTGALLVRLAVGFCLSLVYPPAVKLLSTWFQADRRSAAIGVMFSFFCLGSAFPQLLYGLAEGFSWRVVIAISSATGGLAGIVVKTCVRIGPHQFPSSKFRVGKMLGICANRNVSLSIIAYCGHQWELFCVWAWCAQFLENIRGRSHQSAHVWAFVIISMGGPGSWLGGHLGDKYGRIRVSMVTVATSGFCTALLGLLDDNCPFAVWISICLLWGLTGLADSPNYSALVTVHAEQQSVGTAVTMQLFCGYLATVLALWLVPTLSDWWSWRWSLVSLSAGPLVSVAALGHMEPRQKPSGDVEGTSTLALTRAANGGRGA